MAKFSMKLPEISLDGLNDQQAIRKIYSYLYQLNEQLRYTMSHLDGENLIDGAVDESALGEDVKKAMQGIAAKAEQDDAGLRERLDRTDRRLLEAEQDIVGLDTRVEGLETNGTDQVHSAAADVDDTGISTTRLQVYSQAADDYVDVTGTAADLAENGWVKSASKSGSTLTLTLSDGTEITYP